MDDEQTLRQLKALDDRLVDAHSVLSARDRVWRRLEMVRPELPTGHSTPPPSLSVVGIRSLTLLTHHMPVSWRAIVDMVAVAILIIGLVSGVGSELHDNGRPDSMMTASVAAASPMATQTEAINRCDSHVLSVTPVFEAHSCSTPVPSTTPGNAAARRPT